MMIDWIILGVLCGLLAGPALLCRARRVPLAPIDALERWCLRFLFLPLLLVSLWLLAVLCPPFALPWCLVGALLSFGCVCGRGTGSRRDRVRGIAHACAGVVAAGLLMSEGLMFTASSGWFPAGDPRLCATLWAGRGLPFMVRALGDDRPWVRAEAVEVLAEIGEDNPLVVPELIAALGDDSEYVRDRAADALVDREDALLQALKWTAGGEEAAPAPPGMTTVSSRLRNRWTDVRVRAINVLARRSLRITKPLLIATRDGEPRVREEAAWALGRMGDGRAVPVLVGLLEDRDVLVRIAAARALGTRGAASVPHLLSALRNSHEEPTPAMLEAFVRIGHPAIQALERAARDADPAMRRKASRALPYVRASLL
jgi:HEAT repeat protein